VGVENVSLSCFICKSEGTTILLNEADSNLFAAALMKKITWLKLANDPISCNFEAISKQF